MVTAAMKLKDTPWKKSYDQTRQDIKKQRHYFDKKGQGHGFSSGHVWKSELRLQRKLSTELMLLNCGFGKDSVSPGVQGDPTSPS